MKIDQDEPFHYSDCSIHNSPAYPEGLCDCGTLNRTAREYAMIKLLENYAVEMELEDTMMNEHEAVPGTEYYGDDHYDIGKELEELKQQELDEEEMAQWYEFDAYQDFTDTTAIYPEDQGLEYTALGLASEAGEYAGKISKLIRDGYYTVDHEALAAELGDVLWFTAQAAAAIGLDLSDVARMNVEKLKSRKERNTIGGSGDER